MFRMANPLSSRNAAVFHLVLCLLIGCVGMHFLVEDALLLAVPSTQESGQCTPLSYDEVTHQDDLAVSVSLLPQNVDSVMPAPPLWVVPVTKPVNSPILTPPKIV